MRSVSWILIALVSLVIVLESIASARIAYFGAPEDDVIVGGVRLSDLGLQPDVAKALRARRGTAASLGLGFGLLLLILAAGSYRRGSVWAWWAILVSSAVVAGCILLRIPALGISQGASTGLAFLVILLALLLDVQRVSRWEQSTEL